MLAADGDDGGGNSREATIDLCGARGAGAVRRRPRPKAIRRQATRRRAAPRDPHHPALDRASTRSASRCGAGRTTCCARSTTTIARSASWSTHAPAISLSVTPVQTASRMPPPRGGVTWDPTSGCRRAMFRRRCRSSAPPAGYRAGAPVDDDDDDAVGSAIPTRRARRVRCPGAAAVAFEQCRAAAAAWRCDAAERRRAMFRRCRSRMSSPADPDRSGMLPPPPERFPQRAAPRRAKPKPVKRAAAAPPKQAPLPKPKPAAKADAPPAPAPQAAPQSAPPMLPRPPKRRRTDSRRQNESAPGASGALHSAEEPLS